MCTKKNNNIKETYPFLNKKYNLPTVVNKQIQKWNIQQI